MKVALSVWEGDNLDFSTSLSGSIPAFFPNTVHRENSVPSLHSSYALSIRMLIGAAAY